MSTKPKTKAKPVLHFNVHLQRLRPLPHFPYPWRIAMETVSDKNYYHRPALRPIRPTHFLFKYSLKGVGCYRDARGIYFVPTGSGFLCDMADPEAAYYYPPQAQTPWQFVYVAFYAERMSACSLLQQLGPVFNVPRTHALIRNLLRYQNANAREFDLTAAEGLRFVTEILATLTSCAQQQHPDHSESTIHRARNIIHDQIEGNLDVNGLAARLGIAREYLGRIFRKELGIPPSRYIKRMRMRRACELLMQEANSTIGEIAIRLGFDTASHFARAFRECCGMNPGAYRALGDSNLLFEDLPRI